ncbi:unnamed protein product, partial [Mesorhabditis spiculigera]
MSFDDSGSGSPQMLRPPLQSAGTEWKNIQQNTFTRWVNSHLQNASTEIQDLQTDFSDGVKLIKLVEVLAKRPLGKYCSTVRFRHQQLENVSLALNFLQDDEGIKIVNIGLTFCKCSI